MNKNQSDQQDCEELTPQEALELYPKTGILILINQPEGIELGINNTGWRIGSKFKGFKLIPQGSHYVHYALKDENFEYKQGFFIMSKPGEVIVKKFNEETSEFTELYDDEEESRYVSCAKNLELDEYLGPYPRNKHALWAESSSYIDKRVLYKLVPTNTIITGTTNEYYIGSKKNHFEDDMDSKIEILASNEEDKSFNNVHKKKASESMDTERLPSQDAHLEPFANLKDNANTNNIIWSEIPNYEKKNNWGLKGKDLTAAFLDRSSILNEILTREYQNEYGILFGELQFSFVVFLQGENYEGFDQWKKMQFLITHSKKIIVEKPDFFKDFIRVVFSQVKQFPAEFFIEGITKENFIFACVEKFQNNLDDLKKENIKVSEVVLSRADKLKNLFIESFGVFKPKETPQKRSIVKIMDDGYGSDEEIPDDELPIVVDDLNFVTL